MQRNRTLYLLVNDHFANQTHLTQQLRPFRFTVRVLGQTRSVQLLVKLEFAETDPANERDKPGTPDSGEADQGNQQGSAEHQHAAGLVQHVLIQHQHFQTDAQHLPAF